MHKLEDIFKELAWEKKGIRIDGSYLNNLRFVYDIVLILNDVNEPGEMLEQLNNAAKKVKVRMILRISDCVKCQRVCLPGSRYKIG